MKSVRTGNHIVLAGLLLATGLTTGWGADESTQRRATPIIFSAPKSDTVSSNLNQLGTKSFPLTDLESGLTKPFEIFEGGRSESFRAPPMQFTPPAPVLNSKKLKELMEKNAEQNYLTPDEKESRTGDDLLKSDEDPFSPNARRLETQLDRYYDRIDRTRTAMTNQARNPDLFGEKNAPDEKDGKDDLVVKSSGGIFGNELSATARSLKQMSNSSPEGGRPASDKLKPRSFGDIFGLNSLETSPAAARKDEKESRLDEFKRLLDGPVYTARDGFNAATPPSVSTPFQTLKPAPAAPSPRWSPAPQPAARDSFANTAGLVGGPGKPAALPDFALSTPSLTPAPTIQPPPIQPPKPTFNVPRRRF